MGGAGSCVFPLLMLPAMQVPWEEWVLHVHSRTEPVFGQPEALLRKRELQGRLRRLMWHIHGIVNQRRGHLPKVKISNESALCFPFEIKVSFLSGAWC